MDGKRYDSSRKRKLPVENDRQVNLTTEWILEEGRKDRERQTDITITIPSRIHIHTTTKGGGKTMRKQQATDYR
jgi:hypothetical protein